LSPRSVGPSDDLLQADLSIVLLISFTLDLSRLTLTIVDQLDQLGRFGRLDKVDQRLGLIDLANLVNFTNHLRVSCNSNILHQRSEKSLFQKKTGLEAFVSFGMRLKMSIA